MAKPDFFNHIWIINTALVNRPKSSVAKSLLMPIRVQVKLGYMGFCEGFKGKSGEMPCFPNVLALFLNHPHEISFNPKTLQ